RQLSAYLRQRLDSLPHLRCLTPTQPDLSSAGIVTYALDQGRNGDLAAQLHDEHNIWVKSAAGTYTIEGGLPHEDYNALRFSTHVYNDEAQIDRLADILGEMLKS
ncbi:MAG: aminotransferase class V-fold PLP-dependent enzyme, partial [Candidatus Latescibacteria bacterium]|nr:aminotransferase class V-fold PLP-dependent enzyme [Candidatus Latescibacterota bacterium]